MMLPSRRFFDAPRALVLAVITFGITAGVLAQSNPPDFSGEWLLDKEKSTRPDVLSETIDHHGPKVVITSTSANGPSYTIRLTTDGKDVLNIVGGREMTAQTKWEGESLVTLVRDANGMGFTEVRSLSEEGRVQTVEGFMDPGRKQAVFKRVMKKK